MGNTVFFEHNSFNDYIKFFNLKMNFSVEELESSKYQKLLENKNDKTIEDKYQKLLSITLQGLENNLENVFENNSIKEQYFEKYKSEFLKGFQKKYEAKKPYLKNEQGLNLELDSVNEIVKTYKEKIIESNPNTFADIINAFYSQYNNASKEFLIDYYDRTKELNNNRGSNILEYVKNERINNILNDNLYNLVDTKLPVQLLNNQKELQNKINNYLYLLQNEYEDQKNDNVLAHYKQDIENFIIELSYKMKEEISKKVYKNDIDIENEYNQLIEMIKPMIKKFDDNIMDTLRIAFDETIRKANNLDVPKKDLNTKLKNATTFENYNEIYEKMFKEEEQQPLIKEERELDVIPVNRTRF